MWTLLAGLVLAQSGDESWLNPPDGPQLALSAELGFLAPLYHRVQFGEDGTEINYIQEGGQGNLFPFVRLEADATFGRSIVTLLYQPIDLRTEATFYEDKVIDGEVFAAGTPVDLRYGFSFWRASWMWDLAPSDEVTTGLGLSLQIRNASLEFSSADGTQRIANQNIGPVPVLKFRHRRPIGERFFFVGEVDGFWAPIRYFNGGSSDVEGAIVDASLRGGWTLRHGAETYLNLRWIGGGAVGTSNNPDTPGADGYTRNWIHTLNLSLGFTLR